MMPWNWVQQHRHTIYPLLVLVIAFVTFYRGFEKPNAVFWDENYHIASAQKYIEGVMFMEPHPPLGKQIIAMGEWLLGDNKHLDTSGFLETDYIKGQDFPEEFQFRSYRISSVLMATLAAAIVYYILFQIGGNAHLALLFSSLYLFDNALILHTRSAMLEGIQFFFILVSLLYFVTAMKKERISWKEYAILGLWISAGIAVKLNGAVMLILFVFLFVKHNWKHIERLGSEWWLLVKNFAVAVPVSIVATSAVFLLSFYVHIANGDRIIDDRTYKASKEFKQLLAEGKNHTLEGFVIGLRDNLKFVSSYAKGVPRLDPCKKGENGSHATGWPLGKKTINYRWNKETSNGVTKVQYLYLHGNPVVWLSSLLGIVLGFSLIAARFVFGYPPKDERLFWWIFIFTGLWLAYMIAILQIERVMYLYHYFIPLLFAMINLPILFQYLYKEELERGSWHVYINVIGFAALVFAVYLFFSPFSYHLPLTEDEFRLRQWFEFWQLEPIK